LPDGCVGCVALVGSLQYQASWVRSRICRASLPQVPQMQVSLTPCDTALVRDDLVGCDPHWRVPCNNTNTASYRWRVGDAPRRHTGIHSNPPTQQPTNNLRTAYQQPTNSLPRVLPLFGQCYRSKRERRRAVTLALKELVDVELYQSKVGLPVALSSPGKNLAKNSRTKRLCTRWCREAATCMSSALRPCRLDLSLQWGHAQLTMPYCSVCRRDSTQPVT